MRTGRARANRVMNMYTESEGTPEYKIVGLFEARCRSIRGSGLPLQPQTKYPRCPQTKTLRMALRKKLHAYQVSSSPPDLGQPRSLP